MINIYIIFYKECIKGSIVRGRMVNFLKKKLFKNLRKQDNNFFNVLYVKWISLKREQAATKNNSFRNDKTATLRFSTFWLKRGGGHPGLFLPPHILVSWVLFSTDLDYWLTRGMTGQQVMVTTPSHLILLLEYIHMSVFTMHSFFYHEIRVRYSFQSVPSLPDAKSAIFHPYNGGCINLSPFQIAPVTGIRI